MNPLQRHAISRSIQLAAESKLPNGPHKNISTAALVDLVARSNGSLAPLPMGAPHTLPSPRQSPSESRADIAICVGGGNDPLAEFEAALALCSAESKSVATFVCNDMLACFPHEITHGCTLHPDKWTYWRSLRLRADYPLPHKLWAHRPYEHFTNYTKDWQGSSGLFMVKIARELGYTHILLAGIPMNVEGGHFARGQLWNAAPGFRRGWARVQGSLRPFVRSMSGWTKEHFGAPDAAWINADIPDPYPMRGADHSGVTA